MNESKQTRINFLTNIASLVANVLIGLFYTPYLVHALGMVAYGIVPLALIINQYISLITGSLTGSLTRFYSIALQQGNKEEASRYLSTSIIVIAVIVLALTPVFVLIVTNIDHVFNIPHYLVSEAKILFSFTFLSFIFSLFSSIFNITLYALNRLDLMNVVTIIRIVAKYLLTIIFFELLQKNVAYIGYANGITELIALIINVFFFVYLTKKGIIIHLRYFDKTVLAAVLEMTVWVLVQQLGDAGLYGTDNILVNHFWSTKESGILGALSNFGNYVMQITSVVSSLFGPLILIAYSKHEHDKVKELALTNSLFVGILSAICVGIFVGFAKPIISLWLGATYATYSYWFIIKLITIPAYAAAGIFAFTYRAWNKVRFPAIFTVTIGIVNLILSFSIFHFWRDFPNIISYVLTLTAILVLIQSYGLNSFWFSHLYPGNKIKVVTNLLKILGVTAASSFCAFVINRFFLATSVKKLLVEMLICGIFSSFAVFVLVLNRKQQLNILKMIKSYKIH
jgi:O-antigen/teichoic acid export membrane protein